MAEAETKAGPIAAPRPELVRGPRLTKTPGPNDKPMGLPRRVTACPKIRCQEPAYKFDVESSSEEFQPPRLPPQPNATGFRNKHGYTQRDRCCPAGL